MTDFNLQPTQLIRPGEIFIMMEKLNRIIVGILVFFVIIMLVTGAISTYFSNLSNPVPCSEGYCRLTNSAYGFSIEHPKAWYAAVYGENGFHGVEEVKFRTYRSTFGPTYILLQYRNVSNPDMESLQEWSKSIAKSKRLQSISMQFEDLNGHEVLRSQYSGQDYLYEHVGILGENNMVLIIYEVEKEKYENYIENFNHVVNSFETVE